MTDHTDESVLTQRKGSDEKISKESESDDAAIVNEENIEQIQSTWKNIKYYFNRFRYYHFIVADTVDKYLSAACLWLINLYFKLFMGVAEEPASIFTEDD